MGLFAEEGTPEAEAYLRKQYPNAAIRGPVEDVYGVLPPGGDLMMSNPPGFERGDIAQFAGEVGPATAGAAAAIPVAASGGLTGGLTTLLAPPAGALAGELAREGIQRVYGTQRESTGDYMTRAGVGAAFEALPLIGKLGKKGWRYLRGRLEGTELAESFAGMADDEIAEILEATKNGLDLPALKNFQKSDSPVVARWASQSIQFSQKAQQRLTDQMNKLRESAEKMAPTVSGPSSADEIVQDQMVKYYDQTKTALAGPPVEATKAGLASQKLVTQGLDNRKTAMGKSFDKVDTIVGAHNPNFDLSKTQAAAKDRQQWGMVADPEQWDVWFKKGEGSPAGPYPLKNITGYLNVADPQIKLTRINEVLARLDPTQDYATMKELRSRVGSLLDMPLAKKLESGLDIGAAKRIYGELSEAMKNPQGLIPGAEKGYKKAFADAQEKALKYYDTYDQQQVGEILSSVEGQTPTTLFNKLAKNPAMVEEALTGLMKEAKDSPEVLSTLTGNLKSVIMRSDNPYQTLKDWETANASATRWLFGNDMQKRKVAYQNAKELTELQAGPAGKAASAAFVESNFARDAIRESVQKGRRGGNAARRSEELIRTVGGPGSKGHKALRSALFADVLEDSVELHKKSGAWTINPDTLAQNIQAIEKDGTQRILSGKDKHALSILQKFAKRSWKSGDAGTGLAVASQIGQARQGDWGALVSMRVAHNMANWLTQETMTPESLLKFIPKRSGSLTSRAYGETLRAVRQGMAHSVSAQINSEDEQEVSGP